MLASRSFLSRWQRSLRFRAISLVLCVLFIHSLAVAVAPVPSGAPSTYPSWWFSQGLIPQITTNPQPVWPADYPTPDDYAAANVGQLKQIATKAAAELNTNLPGGAVTGTAAGDAINNLITQWTAQPATGVTRDDYAALTMGQLKAVAQVFYDRLIAVHYTNAYPWTTSDLAADDYAVVNVGQLKNMFSFDVAHSTLNDGLPDWFVLYWGLGSVTDTSVASADPDGDGVTNLQEYQNGTDPTDYYDGQPVVLTLMSGGSQTGPPGTFLPQPIVVSVAKTDGTLWPAGAPVNFTADPGFGAYSTVGDHSAPSQSQLTVLTVANGLAQVYFQPATSVTGSGYANASAQQLPFTESGYDPTSAPSVTPSLQTASTTPGQTTLIWTTNATNVTTTAIQQWTYATGWQTIATVAAGTTTYTITNAPTDVVVLYQVISGNTAGQSSASTVQSATGVDPTTVDSDNDGLSDAAEALAGSDPKNPKTLNDGRLDGEHLRPMDSELPEPPVPESNYAVVDLTNMGFINPTGINDSLQILDNPPDPIEGAVDANGNPIPVITSRIWTNGVFTNIPLPKSTLPSSNTWLGPSNAGQVANLADYLDPTNTAHGIVTVQPGSIELDYTHSLANNATVLVTQVYANKMTASGMVLGQNWGSDASFATYSTGLSWNAVGGVAVPLGSVILSSLIIPNGPIQVTTGTYMNPSDQNKNGVTVGAVQQYNTDLTYRAGITSGGVPVPLPNSGPSSAVALNNLKPPLVVGTEYNAAISRNRVVLWAVVNNAWKEKSVGPPNPPDGSGNVTYADLYGQVWGINDSCEIVGSFYDQNNKWLGGLWQNGNVVNLDTRVPPKTYIGINPVQINNNGAILAKALRVSDNTEVSILLLPVRLSVKNIGAAPSSGLSPGWNIQTNTLASYAFQATATIQAPSYFNVKLDILQDLGSETKVTYEDGSSTACQCNFMPDLGSLITPPATKPAATDAQGNMTRTLTDTPNRPIKFGRPYDLVISDTGTARDFALITVGNNPPQVVAEVDWKYNDGVNFLSVSPPGASTHLATAYQGGANYTTYPDYMKTFCGRAPSPSVQPNEPRNSNPDDPSNADGYFQQVSNWVQSPNSGKEANTYPYP